MRQASIARRIYLCMYYHFSKHVRRIFTAENRYSVSLEPQVWKLAALLLVQVEPR